MGFSLIVSSSNPAGGTSPRALEGAAPLASDGIDGFDGLDDPRPNFHHASPISTIPTTAAATLPPITPALLDDSFFFGTESPPPFQK